MTRASSFAVMTCLLVLPGILTGCARTRESEPAPAEEGDVAAFITRQMETAKFPGLAACIVKDGQIRWAQGFGYADVAAARPVTPDTPFLLGSVAKAVTCIAVMQLSEQGLLDLDADVNTYLPFEVRNPTHPDAAICARMLLAHTSGIRDDVAIYKSLYTLHTGGGDSPMPLDQFLRDYLAMGGAWCEAQVTYAAFAPGEQFLHSNVGIALAGCLVETVSGISFDAYCKQRIFDPLGMTDTHWFLQDANPDNIAIPYRFDVVSNAYVPYGHYGYPSYPDGQLRTSVNAFARLLIAVMNDGRYGDVRILKPESVQEMVTIQYPEQNPDVGLVWWYGLVGGREAIGLDGTDAGVCTSAFFLRGEKTGVLLFANGDASAIADDVRFAIQDRLVREAAKL